MRRSVKVSERSTTKVRRTFVLTMPILSSRTVAMTTGMAFQVMSKRGSLKSMVVTAVLTAPAAVAKTPPANRLAMTICCFLGNLSWRTYGIGTSTMRKSVMVLMHPAASRCFSSLMHDCGVGDRVQYAEGGLIILLVCGSSEMGKLSG